jgi:4-nitrophenyl phosphatase
VTSPSDHDWSVTRFVLCDLDGVVWLARQAIPGSPSAIERLRAAGMRVVFVTNNSMSFVADQEAALEMIGVPARGDVVTSAQAAASLVDAGERVLICGGPGVVEAVEARGGVPIRSGRADAVIVGLHQDVDYWRIEAAARAVRNGARFIATNDDATYPTPLGPTPGAGALVAAVATAAGADPVIAGKPYGPMATLVAQRCGVADPEAFASSAVMVGDRYDTDGRFAHEIGCPFALVRTGVAPPGTSVEGDIALDLADLAAVSAVLVPE